MIKSILGIIVLFQLSYGDGKALYKECAECHGLKGEKSVYDKTRKIATFTKEDLIKSLTSYKLGKKSFYGFGLMMQKKTRKLSKKEIDELASYISMFQPKKKQPKLEVTPIKKKYKYREPPEKRVLYPDIPEFPRHTNSKIKIEKFDYLVHMSATKNYFYGLGEKGLHIYSKDFSFIKAIKNGISNVSANGVVYSIGKKRSSIDTPTDISQYKPPKFEKERLEIEDLFEIKDKKTEIVKLSKNLICVDRLTTFTYKLVYRDRDLILWANSSDIKKISKKNCGYPIQIFNLYKEPKSFHMEVVGKISEIFYSVPYGYNYIELTLGYPLFRETTKFKVANIRGESGVYILYQSRKKIILKDDSYLYKVTKQ